MGAPSETLNALFLAELEALDAFAARRESEGGLLPGREDPDVRRLIEAMAFFSARTRAAAAASMRAAVQRIAAGTLDELLVPSPAALMVQALPDAGLVEPSTVPGGSLLRVVTKEGKVGIFSTTRPLGILPLAIEGAALVEAKRRLFAVLRLRALRPFRGALELSFYVRRLNDYRASLALHDALEQHYVRAFAVVDGDGRELPCRVTFGAPRPRRLEDEAGEKGKLAEIRSFFHQPEQALFLHVSVPAEGSPFRTLSIHLELDEAFPSEMAIPNDAFHLFVVPAHNAWNELTAPIICDGTKDDYPLRSPSGTLSDVEFSGLRGVYKVSERGLVPLLPAALAQRGDTYELELPEDDRAPRLRLHVEGALTRPAKVQVDACWSQPRLFSAAVGRVAITLQTRHLPAVTFGALGPMRRPAESSLSRDPARCLDVLSLRMRPALDLRDLVGLLEILGTEGDGPYRGAHARVTELASSEASDPARRASGIRRVYSLALARKSPEDAPLLRQLAAQVTALLDAWTEDPVDVAIETRDPDARRALSARGTRA